MGTRNSYQWNYFCWFYTSKMLCQVKEARQKVTHCAISLTQRGWNDKIREMSRSWPALVPAPLSFPSLRVSLPATGWLQSARPGLSPKGAPYKPSPAPLTASTCLPCLGPHSPGLLAEDTLLSAIQHGTPRSQLHSSYVPPPRRLSFPIGTKVIITLFQLSYEPGWKCKAQVRT